jgi:4-amino-4-deoxy-L-arabinose transferase-like glycosyltransferase
MTAGTTTSAAHATDEPPAGRRTFLPGLPTWVIGLGLVALHLVVTFLVRPAPRWNDGIFVLNRARDFPHVPLDHHSLRIGNIIPVRGFLEVFGYGQWSYYAWPFLTGILLVAATFALGIVLFDRWTSAVATVLLIVHPVLVDTIIKAGSERMTSWQLLPDIPSTAFVVLGFALLIGAAQKRPATEDGPGARAGDAAPTWWFLLAGFCFGWAYLVRELSVFFYPLVLGALIAWRLPLRRWVQLAIPMLGCLVLEMVLAQWAHGDPLARLKVDSEHGSAPLSPITRVDALLRFPRIVEVYPGTIVVLTTLVLTVLGALVVRRKANVLLLFWFLVIWVPLTLVSGLLDPGFIRINASLMRYWIPVLPALVLGACGFAAWVLGQVRSWLPEGRRAVGVALTVAVAVLGLAAAVVPVQRYVTRNPRDEAWNAMRAYLAEHDKKIDTIITDDRDSLVLGIYSREPVGGDLVTHNDLEKVPHALRSPPESPGDPGTYLLWTPGLSKKRPQESDGWKPVVEEFQLRLYAPTTPTG